MAMVRILAPLLAACTVAKGHPVSQSIDQSGGQIAISVADDPLLAGTVLSVPAGALNSATMILISRGLEITTGTEPAVSPSVIISPDFTFAKAATLTLPYSPARAPVASGLILISSDAGKRTELTGNAIDVSDASTRATASITHTGTFELTAATCSSAVGGDLGSIIVDDAGNITLDDAGADLSATPPTITNCTAVTM